MDGLGRIRPGGFGARRFGVDVGRGRGLGGRLLGDVFPLRGGGGRRGARGGLCGRRDVLGNHLGERIGGDGSDVGIIGGLWVADARRVDERGRKDERGQKPRRVFQKTTCRPRGPRSPRLRMAPWRRRDARWVSKARRGIARGACFVSVAAIRAIGRALATDAGRQDGRVRGNAKARPDLRSRRQENARARATVDARTLAGASATAVARRGLVRVVTGDMFGGVDSGDVRVECALK